MGTLAEWRAAGAAHAVPHLASLSRRLGAGSGSVIGGRLGLALDPRVLTHLGRGREIALVSGTNGKTTTTAMLAAALGELGEVATSSEGANMPAGIVSALCGAPRARRAALEVDEGYLPRVIAELAPSVVVALNLSRDQLDRVGEVRMIATRWRKALSDSAATVLANADDPLVCFAAQHARATRFVGVGGLWHADAVHCPICDEKITFVDPPPSTAGAWSCSCGFRRPDTTAELVGSELLFADGESVTLPASMPGRFNAANAAMALCAARHLGVPVAPAVARVEAVTSVSGRFRVLEVGGVRARLLLAKNPAGWTEMLDLVRAGDDPLVVAINARAEDGQDPSWLWDVPFELLSSRAVSATGERRRDLAVRLLHAGLDHRVVADPLDAFLSVRAETVDVIANYSAFQQIRRRLEAGAGPRAPGRASPAARASEAPVPARRAPAAVAPRGDRLSIVLVYPDLLGTYGDSGNARVLLNRALWRGVAAHLRVATVDDALPGDGDLYVLGGAEDGPQIRAAAALSDGRLAGAIGDGAVVFGVCAGFQLLGRSFPAGNSTVAGAGVLAMETRRVARPRAVGEVRAEASGALAHLGTLTGFENHAGRTVLDGGAEPLGRVRVGVGNDEEARVDGAQSGRVLGTYLHGPVLARNPALADHLLCLALGHGLVALDDAEVGELRAERLSASARRGARLAIGRG